VGRQRAGTRFQGTGGELSCAGLVLQHRQFEQPRQRFPGISILHKANGCPQAHLAPDSARWAGNGAIEGGVARHRSEVIRRYGLGLSFDFLLQRCPLFGSGAGEQLSDLGADPQVGAYLQRGVFR